MTGLPRFETVARLQRAVRPSAGYARSLGVLARAKAAGDQDALKEAIARFTEAANEMRQIKAEIEKRDRGK